ncbi:hypothetical protein D3C77_222930 [compost metagenome]
MRRALGDHHHVDRHRGAFARDAVADVHAVAGLVRAAHGLQYVAAEADGHADVAVGQVTDVLRLVEVADVGTNRHQGGFGLFQVCRVLTMWVQPQGLEGDGNDLGRIVEKRHAALAELLDVLRLEQHVPGLGHVGTAEDRLDLVNVVADAGGHPHVGNRVAVARVAGLEDFHQLGIEVVPVRQLAAIQLLNGPGLDQARQEVVGRAGQVIATAAGHQLGLGGLVAVDQVVGGLDLGATSELAQGVVGDVTTPVGNVDGFSRLGRRGQQRHRQQGHAGALDHGVPLLFLLRRVRRRFQRSLRARQTSQAMRALAPMSKNGLGGR